MRKLLTLIDRDGERWLLLVLYIYVVAVIFIEVVRRFVLDYSSIWGEETARYAFIYLVWIGAAAAVRDRAHIRIDVLLTFLPPRARAAISLLGDLLVGALAALIFYLSLHPFLSAIQFGSVTEGLRVMRAWVLFAIPFGFALLMLRVAQSIYFDLSDLRAGRAPRAGRKLFD
ncbi:TRAP-type C4-dicarboxylate transport system permease small subunit [Natronocella acetinitrilica]|uniref:TRAP transporter small permease protein n=1 Tax=Natronocella acetinitrilica TaxID=414046 RepID=A0AAE3KAN7_9GAMM|nr:TRAP transporter small permease [Natronocella acetinitrilica]MCP1673641.1 TRAP-type C4-dicarboxylate transport system permease small subunit [Natronocella acetinitrilica]